ncbi:MAG TPA: SCO2523 family variant P-loop protein [Actinocrinis sp.]|jgi:hypothetical protein
MLVFSVSDKGGTGRSVTSTNLAYQYAFDGRDTCYLDFDFGSPTVGAIFDVGEAAARGVEQGGLHEYLAGQPTRLTRIDVWSASRRETLDRPPRAGRLTLVPGSLGGGEFVLDDDMVDRCAALFAQIDDEYELTLVDLSAGRSFAVDMALRATALQALEGVTTRWLVFHKWTRQHIVAADGLVFGAGGLLDSAKAAGHTEERARGMIRFVRTALIDTASDTVRHLSTQQLNWLYSINGELEKMADSRGLGSTVRIASIPLDPVLQWREQLITGRDVASPPIANQATYDAFRELAAALDDESRWGEV